MFNHNCGGYSLSDVAAVTGRNNDNDGFGGNGAWWIIILFLFVFCGWGNRGWGNDGGNIQPALTRGELCQDMNFADLETAVRGVQTGLCDGFYSMNSTLLNGFNQAELSRCQQQAALMQMLNQINYNQKDCCCQEQQAIAGAVTQSVMNTNALQAQIKDCCCENEKINMQNRFDAAQYNCQTQQAIDKLGDRIIDFMCNRENQNMRDELFALRLAASQEKQNNYLINTLRPQPVPAFDVPAPWQFNNCGCNNYGNYGC